MTALQLKNVNISIEKKDILYDIGFSIKKGTLLGLIGPNGSGKSTLLKSIATLLPLKTGNIIINNKAQHLYSQKELATQMSYVPQETVIGFDFNAWDIVAMGRHIYGSVFKGETAEDIAKIKWAMEQTQTYHFAEQSILNLSGGQQQLIMIAKALAQDTPIILLDEPISALDVFFQLHILALLQKLCEQGKTIIIVLHDLNLASRFCDKLLLLNEGKIQKYGSPQKVLTEPLLRKIYHINAKVRKDQLVNCMTVTPFL